MRGQTQETTLTHFKVQEWPDMRGTWYGGDAIVFRSDWPNNDWQCHESWDAAWDYLAGNCEPGDTVEVLKEGRGRRLDTYPEKGSLSEATEAG